MFCVAAAVVLGLLGIVSARHRALAVEAFHCVFQSAKREPCDTGFDQRMKSEVTARLMRWPRLARLWRRHPALISWLFVLLLLGSLGAVALGLYNLAVFGSCTPSNPGACPV